jgi:hypothetical protein
MKNLKKTLRLLGLIVIIALASVLPVPVTFYRKDNQPKFKIEQIDKKKEDDNENELELFS